MIHPAIVLFLFGMVYMISGVAEYFYLRSRRKRGGEAAA